VANTDRIKNVVARGRQVPRQRRSDRSSSFRHERVTDNLIRLAKEIMPLPNEREMTCCWPRGTTTHCPGGDFSARLGRAGGFLTGAQAGIVTAASIPG